MNASRWSSIFSHIPLPCRMQTINSRQFCRSVVTCRLFRTLSVPKFKDVVACRYVSSVVNKEQNILHISRRYYSTESSFQEMISFRHKQANRSVVIEVPLKADIPRVLKICKDYGDVNLMIAFHGNKKSKLHVIAEFSREEPVQKLMSDVSFKYANEGIPYHSRSLRFENHGKQKNITVAPGEVMDLTLGPNNSHSKQPSSVSEMILELYEKEKMSDISIRLRFICCVMLQDALKGIFPYCTAFPFGSSTSMFGKDNSDLDIMLRLSPEKAIKNPELYLKTRYAKTAHTLQRITVYVIGDILQTFAAGIYNVQRIANARVPIVKYECQLLNLECDVSINNMSGVYMTEIMFYCGELDPRIRPLMYTLKEWATQAGITTKEPGTAVTNFCLSLLMLFFLQSRPVPVLSPLNKLVKIPLPDEYRTSAVEYFHEGTSKKSKPSFIGKNNESLEVLLREFFRFLTVFPFPEQRISLIGGSSSPRESGNAIWIDYPMDETQNASKNVMFQDLDDLCEAALKSLKSLEQFSSSDMNATDIMSVLGVSDTINDISNKIDVRAFLDVN